MRPQPQIIRVIDLETTGNAPPGPLPVNMTTPT